MSVKLRYATAADIAHFVTGPLPYRIRAFAAETNRSLLGIGGLAFQPSGTIAAFLLIKPEARKFPIALHKAGLRTLAEARALGIRRIVALAEEGNAAAEPWLARLGFDRVQVNDEFAWVWQDKK